MSTKLLIQTIANAIAVSGMYALIAVGLTLAFGVMQMANLSHGHFFMAGAYTVYALYALNNWPFWVAVASATGIGAVIGLAVERGIFRPLRGDVVAGFIATAGLMFVFEVFMGEVWGWGYMRPVISPYMRAIKFMGASVAFQRIIIIPFAIACIGGLLIFIAESIGISIPRNRLLTCAIGSFFAGIAGGILVHRLGAVDPKMFNITTMLYLLIWVVVGGTNTFWGPIIGVSVMHTLFELSRPLIQIRPMFFGLSMILVLLFMPGGIESLISKAIARLRKLPGMPTAGAE